MGDPCERMLGERSVLRRAILADFPTHSVAACQFLLFRRVSDPPACVNSSQSEETGSFYSICGRCLDRPRTGRPVCLFALFPLRVLLCWVAVWPPTSGAPMAVSLLSESHGVMHARPSSGRSCPSQDRHVPLPRFLLAVALVVHTGCASPPPPPPSAAVRATLGTIGVVGASWAPGSTSPRRRDESRRERVRVRRRARASGPGWVPSMDLGQACHFRRRGSSSCLRASSPVASPGRSWARPPQKSRQGNTCARSWATSR